MAISFFTYRRDKISKIFENILSDYKHSEKDNDLINSTLPSYKKSTNNNQKKKTNNKLTNDNINSKNKEIEKQKKI